MPVTQQSEEGFGTPKERGPGVRPRVLYKPIVRKP